MSRILAREYAMNCIYQMEMKSEFSYGAVEYYINNVSEEVSESDFINRIVKAFLENKESIDAEITKNLKGWKLDRIAKVDLAILRLALTEFQFIDDVPVSVTINEAINLGKKFNDDESGQFINGVLGQVVKNLGLLNE